MSPTTKYGKLLELTDTKCHIKSISKCRDVPYCDTFSVEEELLVLAPSPTASCCILRIAVFLIWHKSTMFKGKI